MLDLLREILQTLRNNKLRTALTGFAVAWGIFMLIILLGMSRGVYNNFQSFASADRSNTMSVWGGWTMHAHKGYKEGRRIRLLDSDRTRIYKDDAEHISSVQGSIVLDSAKLSTSRDYITEAVYGRFPDEVKYAKLNMLKGRFLNQLDLDEKRKVVVISSQSARTLFGDENNAVGNYVKAMSLAWQVIGVYQHEWETGSYVPYTTAMMLNGNDGRVGELIVRIKNVNSVEDGEAVEQSVRNSLAATHEFDTSDRGAVHIWNRFVNYLTNLEANNILNMTIWIIGLLTMLSGIVGVSNIMFVSVRERTHEIGIRRAIGAKPRSILLQIVTESIAITTIFGYIGIVCGTFITAIIAKISEGTDFLKDPTVNLSVALEVTIVLIIAGALAGLFPAIKATKVRPVEALRDE
ncbi:MAG: ABC transporter permease [Paramuribaculum sp.]|nr:ABC transporter permease [Paramuribaculum sp.]